MGKKCWLKVEGLGLGVWELGEQRCACVQLLALPEEEQLAALQAYMAAAAAEAAGVADLDPDRPLLELGLDSLRAAEFAVQVRPSLLKRWVSSSAQAGIILAAQLLRFESVALPYLCMCRLHGPFSWLLTRLLETLSVRKASVGMLSL